MSHHERRRHERRALSFPVLVTTDRAGPTTQQERLHNISDGGISFLTEDAESYQIDERLTISITSDSESVSSLTSGATVVWIEHDPFRLNQATIGVQFLEIIETENLIA